MPFRRFPLRPVGVYLLVALALAACAPPEARPAAEGGAVPEPSSPPEGPERPEGPPLFEDVSAAVGLRFEHDNGRRGELYFVEPTGAGGALADFDGDGDLDLFLPQGHPLPTVAELSEGAGPSDGEGSLGRLFRNDLASDPVEAPTLRLVDVTEESGLRAFGYGMGAATGDFDNDGRIDLYLTNFGANQLWRNVSEGSLIRFEEVTSQAGVEDDRWSTSASFTDIDGDGWLDLFVTNYVDFTLRNHRPCRGPSGRPDYCGPQSYRGESDRFFWNRGNGTFRDLSIATGVQAAASSGLGVVAADFDRDGRTDLYVTNDLQRNFLWRNLGSTAEGPRFENIALESGSAVSAMGQAQASMGVVAADLDNDGDDDLFMTHLDADTNTLYRNSGRGLFQDVSAVSGLGTPSMENTGFGTVALDVDRDGFLDVAVANGAVRMVESQVRAGDEYPLKQPNQLYRNLGNGTFEEISHRGGDAFDRWEVSRGLAVGDVDNDGRVDLLLTNNSGPARLLLGRGEDRSWIGLRLLTAEGRDALGARVALRRQGGGTLWRRAATDGSFLAANDPRVLVGLGGDTAVPEVLVLWPSGEAEAFRELTPGRYQTLRAGHGETTPATPFLASKS